LRSPEMKMGPELRSTEGFTLLEVLVALGVCGIFIATLAPVISTNRLRAGSADSRLAIVAAGHQLLERLPARDEMATGATSGTLGGLKWRIQATPAPVDTEPDHDIPWTAYRVSIDIVAPNGTTRRIETVRLGRGQAP
jgi:prepilin-type N-terminal cleavage/methylation domain-containing protein